MKDADQPDILQSDQHHNCLLPGWYHIHRYNMYTSYELCHKKTCLPGFRHGPTQTRLYNNRTLLEAWIFRFRKYRDCTIYVAKTKALICFAVTAQLICPFVFAYAKSRFSHGMAYISINRCVKTCWYIHHYVIYSINNQSLYLQHNP